MHTVETCDQSYSRQAVSFAVLTWNANTPPIGIGVEIGAHSDTLAQGHLGASADVVHPAAPSPKRATIIAARDLHSHVREKKTCRTTLGT